MGIKSGGLCQKRALDQAGVAEALGPVLITSYELWNNGSEKVFRVSYEGAKRYPNTRWAVLKALLRAARWLDAQENRPEAVDIISRLAYVNSPKEPIGMSMTRTFRYGPGMDPVVMPDFDVFFRFAGDFPWRSRAEWFISQMVRWDQIEGPVDIVAKAATV